MKLLLLLLLYCYYVNTVQLEDLKMPDLPELLDDPCILRGFADDNQEGVQSITFYNWA